MEITGFLANPALKTIYNGKSLRENYSDLDLNDVVYEGMIGALLGSIGGAVNIAKTGRGNAQNYQQGNSRAFGGQMRNANLAGTLRNANLNTLYTAAESNAQRSVPYVAAHTASVQQQRSTPHTANIGTAGHSQPVSYADVFRKMQAEQNMSADSEYARYKELDRKYLDGSIAEHEFEELRRRENIWGQIDASNKYNSYLVKGTADGYTQIDLNEENIRQNFELIQRDSEFDADGNPIFATSRAKAAIDGVDYAALKSARKEADTKYGLTNGEAKSLAGYISTTFAMLNKRMYSGTITDKDAGVVKRITSALEKFPVFSGTTYRNLKFNNEETYNNFLAEYAKGNVLTLKAFTSTSKRPNGYPKFGQYTVHIVIEGISGADISGSYGVPRQQEVILLPGTTLKINGVSLANDGSPIIFAQEVLAYGVEKDHGNE